MDAFDADVLSYAALRIRPLGERVAALFRVGPIHEGAPAVGVGSVLLIPELLTKPMRDGAESEIAALEWRDARMRTSETRHQVYVAGVARGLRVVEVTLPFPPRSALRSARIHFSFVPIEGTGFRSNRLAVKKPS